MPRGKPPGARNRVPKIAVAPASGSDVSVDGMLLFAGLAAPAQGFTVDELIREMGQLGISLSQGTLHVGIKRLTKAGQVQCLGRAYSAVTHRPSNRYGLTDLGTQEAEERMDRLRRMIDDLPTFLGTTPLTRDSERLEDLGQPREIEPEPDWIGSDLPLPSDGDEEDTPSLLPGVPAGWQ